MRVSIRKTPLPFPRQVEVIDPLMLDRKLAILGTKMQSWSFEMLDTDMIATTLDHRVEFMWMAFAMVAAAIHQQIDAKMQGAFGGARQSPCDACCMTLLLHPDALLDDAIADGEIPDRNAAVQPERFQILQSLRFN